MECIAGPVVSNVSYHRVSRTSKTVQCCGSSGCGILLSVSERLFQNPAGLDAMPPYGRPCDSEVRSHLLIGHPEEQDATQDLELPVAKDLASHANSLRDLDFHTAAATVAR